MRSSTSLSCAALLCLCGGIGMAISQWFVFVYAPVEVNMGLIQKIFYIHLPLSWWGLSCFFVVFVSSITYIATRNNSYANLSSAAAELGVLLTTLCLITGMMWGKKSWGVWWTWDPRLTTALVLWFVYVGYLILGSLNIAPNRKNLIRAVVGIVAFADVPLVFLSARMWRSIHPAVFADKSGGLEPEMKITVFICIAAMGLLSAGILVFRKQQIELKQKIEEKLFETTNLFGDE